eukprot:1159327-Pelagomonas_calceolata.AAC.3
MDLTHCARLHSAGPVDSSWTPSSSGRDQMKVAMPIADEPDKDKAMQLKRQVSYIWSLLISLRCAEVRDHALLLSRAAHSVQLFYSSFYCAFQFLCKECKINQ